MAEKTSNLVLHALWKMKESLLFYCLKYFEYCFCYSWERTVSVFIKSVNLSRQMLNGLLEMLAEQHQKWDQVLVIEFFKF